MPESVLAPGPDPGEPPQTGHECGRQHDLGGSSTSRGSKKIVLPAAFVTCLWRFPRVWPWRENAFWHFSRNYRDSSRLTTRRRSSVDFHKEQCSPVTRSCILTIHLPVSCSSPGIFWLRRCGVLSCRNARDCRSFKAMARWTTSSHTSVQSVSVTH